MARKFKDEDGSVYRKTNIRRIRKWKKRRHLSPYLFLLGICVMGIIVTIIVYRNG